MLQFGRNVAEMLRNFLDRRAGLIMATSFMSYGYVSWTDNRNKRKISEVQAKCTFLAEKKKQIEATFGPYEKEFAEFLLWKHEQKKAEQEWVISEKKKLIAELAEGNVPQDDTFTNAGQGDTFSIAGQGDLD